MKTQIATILMVGLLLAVATPAQAESKDPCREAKIAFKAWKDLLTNCTATDNTKARKAAWAKYEKLRDACRALTPAPKCEPVACEPQPAPDPVIIEKPVPVEKKVPYPVYVTPIPPKPAPEPDYRTLRIALGVFGFGYVFQTNNPGFDIIGAWGWGAMMQAQLFATRRLEVDLAIGIGMGLDKVESSPGHFRGYMAQVGATYWMTRHVGLGLNARADLIGLKGLDRNVLVIGGVPGVAFQGETGGARWKLEIGMLVGGAVAEDTPGKALSVGGAAQGTVSF